MVANWRESGPQQGTCTHPAIGWKKSSYKVIDDSPDHPSRPLQQAHPIATRHLVGLKTRRRAGPRTGWAPGMISERIVVQAFAEDAPHSPALQVGRTAPCPQYSPNPGVIANRLTVNTLWYRASCCDAMKLHGQRATLMTETNSFLLHPIGAVKSTLHRREDAPRQGDEGAPDAWLHLSPQWMEALDGIEEGSEIVVLTWLHLGDRTCLKVHPRNNALAPAIGVFATRSPDRPNPIGLHRVTVVEIDPRRGLRVQPLEALDGTPVLDIKPAWHD
jgi:tRNA-Thr(GGU) m(6)t(6)A37 methyltransferase TsaA